MKRLMMLAMLSVTATMLFASAAMAQSYLNESGETCPEGFVAAGDYCYTPEDFEALQTGACEGTPTDEEFLACLAATSGSGTQSESPIPADTGTVVSCEGFISAAGNPSQFQAQQFYDFNATPEEQAILDPDGDGFACDELEAGTDDLGTTSADVPLAEEAPSATYTALPDTGGSSLLLPVSVLLVSVGILGVAVKKIRTS